MDSIIMSLKTILKKTYYPLKKATIEVKNTIGVKVYVFH